MSYVTRKMSLEEKERVWDDMNRTKNFKMGDYFSLLRPTFICSEQWFTYDELSGNYLFNFWESYVDWNFFVFFFRGEFYLMRGRMSTKFFLLSHVSEGIRNDFVDELKKIFLSRGFVGLPLRSERKSDIVCIDGEKIDFDHCSN